MANREHRTGSAREDWNRRAKEDFRHAIHSHTRGEAGDEEFRALGEEEAGEILRWVAVDDTTQMTVLEYGCGVGRLMAPLAKSFHAIHGVDVSDEMVRLGREREGERPDFGFHLLDGERIPFPDASFDLVYSVHVFQHMPRPAFRTILGEIARVLRPGGLLVFQLHRPMSLRRRLKALLRLDRLSLRALRERNAAPETFRRRYYTTWELRTLLARNGLHLEAHGIAHVNPRHHYYRAQGS